jgi:hypothetical protein
MIKIPEKAREVIEAVKHPKVQLTNAFNKARETVIGSGSIPEEIKKVGNAYIDMPATAVTAPLKALGNIVALHPIDATQNIINGGVKLVGDTIDAVTSPSRLGIAGITAGGKVVKETAKLPFKGIGMVAKSPFYVWDAINNGMNKLSKWEESFAKMGVSPAKA